MTVTRQKKYSGGHELTRTWDREFFGQEKNISTWNFVHSFANSALKWNVKCASGPELNWYFKAKFCYVNCF